MPFELPAEINKEKNKLSSPHAWLWLLDVDIEGLANTLRFVNNPEKIVYNTYTYYPCNFALGGYDNSESGRLASRTLSISNADLTKYFLPYIEDYEGLIGSSIIVTPVNSGFPDLDYSAKAQEYEVIKSKITETTISLSLGAPNLLKQRLQQNKYFGMICSYVKHFKGAECQYEGAETVCNGTLDRCRELENEPHFGGCPGMRNKSVRFV